MYGFTNPNDLFSRFYDLSIGRLFRYIAGCIRHFAWFIRHFESCIRHFELPIRHFVRSIRHFWDSIRHFANPISSLQQKSEDTILYPRADCRQTQKI